MVFGQCRSRDADALPADMCFGRFANQPYTAVYAAAEHMFAAAWRHSRLPQIVYSHGDDVVAFVGIRGDIYAECRVSASVLSGQLSVDVHFRVLEHTIELKEDIYVL